jgi:hypothetical protein
MWDVFPIHCEGTSGTPLSTIHPQYPYIRDPDVQVALWHDVPPDVKEWARMIWNDEFTCVRTPLASCDLFAWIPGQATLLARKGYWIGHQKSKPMAMVTCNYVHPLLRGHRLAERMISSIGYEVQAQWSIDVFLFEVHRVPQTLRRRGAVPVCRFEYAWIPTFLPDNRWKLLPSRQIRRILRGRPGFHSKTYPGCIGYRHADTARVVILDAYEDVVMYESWMDLTTLPGDGRYCRVPHPAGQVHIFAENMVVESMAGSVLIP